MHRFLWGKHKALIQGMALFSIFAFSTAVFAASAQFSSIIPTGKVLIYDSGQQVGELTAEAPLPEGKLLATHGKCGVKMGSLYLIAMDKSQFSIQSKNLDKMLTVKQGRVYFAISSLPGPLTFLTPKGAVVAQQVMLKASSDSNLLKGYVSVTDKKTEIGVIEGGSMIVSTAKGEQKLDSGHHMLLAVANLEGSGGGTASGAASGGLIAGMSTGTLAATTLVGGAFIAFPFVISNNTGGNAGSTITPTP